jgi:hypothetical protein
MVRMLALIWRALRSDESADQNLPRNAQCGHWMFGRIFGLDGRESYRELRLEPVCCPHRLSRGTAPHEREYPRRKDRF